MGWYVVYLLMVVINGIMCTLHGYDIFTWQYWVWAFTIILSFVAGSNWRKDE